VTGAVHATGVRRREASGVLVIYLWLERASKVPLRARITSTTELESDERTTVVVSTVEDVLRVVREWVTRIVERPNER
jgi:hypothetical protein